MTETARSLVRLKDCENAREKHGGLRPLQLPSFSYRFGGGNFKSHITYRIENYTPFVYYPSPSRNKKLRELKSKVLSFY